MKICLYIFTSEKPESPTSQHSDNQLKSLDSLVAANEWLLLNYPGGCELFLILDEDKKAPTSAEIIKYLTKIHPDFAAENGNKKELHAGQAVSHFLKNVAGLNIDATGKWFLEPIRDAFEQASEAGYTGPVLHHLFQKGIWLHEKIRMESSFFKFAIHQAAVLRELAGKIFGSVKNKSVHFIGWHEDFQQIVTELESDGAHDFVLHCGDVQSIDPRVKQSNISPVKLNGNLETADLIFIGAPQMKFQLQKAAINRRMAAQNNSRLLICNYSNDTDALQNVKRIYNVFSYEKSELSRLIDHNKSSRKAILQEIELWINEESQNFFQWLDSDKRFNFAGMIGASREMQRIFELISRVARTNITILIDGESGTGKELVARAVHKLSQRADKPFIAVNCGAIPENLLESELFGHEKGAFTGAEFKKSGLIEAAEGGTILLDEIAELQPNLQVKLLRFLQEGEIKHVGGTEIHHPDVRVLAATNKSLADLVEKDLFRRDLYYRLNVLQLTLPPLRNRGDDILHIAQYFLQRINTDFQKEVYEFSPEAKIALQAYSWPGNVRELENAIERACALAVGKSISIYDFPPALHAQNNKTISTEPELHTLKDAEKQHIMKILDLYNWNYEEASKALAIGRTTLWRKLREYGVDQKENQ
ncbi:MAG: AAA family ATPase [Calditrichaeota bacterium]|nr:MAG: AAA family ATPase [Calditrichota bacterium]